MNSSAYYSSLAQELDSLKSRVRNLIGSKHWPSDGEWKESVLRAALRRHLPPQVGMGTGFVVDRGWTSDQLDIIFYDNRHPVLFQDGDFIIVAPPAVRGIVEVKTTLRASELPTILRKLAKNSGCISGGGPESKFVGLFAYDCELGTSPHRRLLDALSEAADTYYWEIVSHISCGSSILTKCCDLEPHDSNRWTGWRSFDLQNEAPGYFLAGLLRTIVGQVESHEFAWFDSEPDPALCQDEQPFLGTH